MARPKRTANYAAWQHVDKREDFQGSSLKGVTYKPDMAPFMSGRDSRLNEYETKQYNKVRSRVTYIVWSFYTPIAYYVESPGGQIPGQWYKVGQSFSQHTGRHRNGALRNVVGHMVVLKERRGDSTVECFDCGTKRGFDHVNDARTAYYLHR